MAKKEYIEREAAIEAAYQGLKRPSNTEEWKRICEQLKNVPAADVVEVVRCKECQYFYNGPKCCMNHVGVVLTDENGFCHHAKRREDEGGDA